MRSRAVRWLVPLLLLALLVGSGASVAGAGEPDYPPIPPPDSDRFSQKSPIPLAEPGITTDVKQRNAGKRVSGDYMFFVDADSKVVRVEVIHSLPGCDEWFIDRSVGSELRNIHRR